LKLSIRNLSADFTMQRTQATLHALKDVTFNVREGSFTVIVGPSGCGKTSLLNILAGLITPAGGEILIDNSRIDGPGRNRAMVFQSPSLLPWRTVLGNVSYGLELQGYSRELAHAIAMNYIRMIGLADFTESYPKELSGGMKQRVNLARALATSPEILLMDEPLASLDPQMREMMQVELQRVWMQTHNTTLFVTHLIDEAVFLADEIIVLTSRPGTIKQVLQVGFPRPRPITIKKDPQFHAIMANLWDLIEEEIIKEPQEGRQVERA
jgi:NitT/TauT family transport system ATP-binding protein